MASKLRCNTARTGKQAYYKPDYSGAGILINAMNQQPGNSTGHQSPPDYSKPVAYDNEGRPLYAHPPSGLPVQQPVPTYVHVSRPLNPEQPEIPADIMRLHEESVRRYPRLNLSKGEFVISAVKRHPIGVIEIWSIALVLIGAIGSLMASFLSDSGVDSDVLLLAATGLGLVSFFIFIGALVATYIYNNNRFFLTNESVIQEIQDTVFSRHEQTVSLSNIEDASYKQHGILPYLLNYGLIRLSTEGDETTYRFNYVANPKKQIAILNNAVEAFKNGRPVALPTDDQPS